MITCKHCGRRDVYSGGVCPACHMEYRLDLAEQEALLDALGSARARREYDTVEEGYHILADQNHLVGIREYAALLEKRGAYDEAMRYAIRAAADDAICSYRYARLAKRIGERAHEFWLRYAAVFGCKDAFFDVAGYYADRGKDEIANYYYTLAALGDDVDAIVTMARRYYDGIGTERSEPYAKWMMDKLTLPPIGALRLAYRLRGVRADEPPAPICEFYDALLSTLCQEAQKYGYRRALFRLLEVASDRGDLYADLKLAAMLLSGDGCARDVGRGLTILHTAAERGSVAAYMKLGDLYLTGAETARDPQAAIGAYERAADLGCGAANEKLGDIYCRGELVAKNVAYAISLYEEGARRADDACARKLRELKDRREAYYEDGMRMWNDAPEQAFRSFTLAAEMGYAQAKVRLGDCYLFGVGTRANRRMAFLWFENAVSSGATEAYHPLGLCYARGIGTRFDYRRAIEMLGRATAVGNHEAAVEAERLNRARYLKLRRNVYSTTMRLLHQKKFVTALKMAHIAMEMGDAKAIYTLGALYEFGIGTKTDTMRARTLYTEAEQAGFSDPRARYKAAILRVIR